MPITTPGSYMQVMQGFIAHWDSVNSAISPDVLTLSGGFTLANFTTARTEIESAMTAIEVADNTRDAAGSVRDQGKSGLLIRFSQVRAAVLTLFPGTIYRRMLPRQPGFSSVESRFLKPFDDAANIWSQINTDSIPGFTPPLKLAGGYTLANFQADIAALRAAYIALTNAESLARQRRSERDALLPPAKERMVQYRQAVIFKLAPGSPLLMIVPTLSRSRGSTPEAIIVTAVWNPVTLMADLSWNPSTNPHLSHYSLRFSPGPVYHTSSESVVAEISKTANSFSTNFGLLAPGSTVLFCVYVVLTTGNEKGSEKFSVTHPA